MALNRQSEPAIRKEVNHLINTEKMKESLQKGGLADLLFSPEKSDLRVKLLLAVGIAAVAFVFLSDYVGNNATSASAEPAVYSASERDYEEYTARLESRLTDLISSVDGAGSAKVMITLECGTEYVYASQRKSTSAILTEEPKSEDLLTERWQFRFDELHQPFQTIVIIHGEDMALLRLLQE